jgi:hypothetical protein
MVFPSFSSVRLECFWPLQETTYPSLPAKPKMCLQRCIFRDLHCCWGFHLLLTLPIPFPTRNGALETCSHFGDKVVNVRHYLSLSLCCRRLCQRWTLDGHTHKSDVAGWHVKGDVCWLAGRKQKVMLPAGMSKMMSAG